jgi:hypothetical protein
VAVAGVAFLETTSTPAVRHPTGPRAHLKQATSAITSKHLAIELAERIEAAAVR